MGYYIDTGSLQSMASAEAILKKRMPEKVGILPVAELLFVAESMWVGEHDMNQVEGHQQQRMPLLWVWRKTCTSFSSGHPAGYVKELSD